jgi:hypothetical protein
MGLVYLETTRDFSIFWVDASGDLIDLENVTIEIIYYDTYMNENFVLSPTEMEHIGTGHYAYSVYLSPTYFMDGERYFVRFRGYNTITEKNELQEETFTAAIDPATLILNRLGLSVSFIRCE